MASYSTELRLVYLRARVAGLFQNIWISGILEEALKLHRL